MAPSPKAKYLLHFAALLCSVVSLCGCQLVSARFIGIKTIEPLELTTLLGRQPAPLVVDLRTSTEFEAGHLSGAIRLNPDGIEGYISRSGLPPQHTIIIICQSGWDSQIAAATIAAAGYRQVYSLNGGFEKLNQLGIPMISGKGTAIPPALLLPPVVHISTLSQLAMTIAAFVIKPLYMMIAALILVLLWRQLAKEMLLLRYAMVSFLFGEGACALNYLVAGNAGLWLEFFHGAGMVGTYALVFGAFFVFMDEKVINYSDDNRRCAMQRFCRHCWKNQAVDCGFFRVSLVALIMLAACALVPVTMPIRPFTIILPVFGSDVLWLKDFWNLFVEYRVYPILGSLSAVACLAILYPGKHRIKQAQPMLFTSIGLIGYAFFRFGLLLTFNENQAWADWWEELSELMLVVLVWVFLVVFRQSYHLQIPPLLVRLTTRTLLFKSKF